MSLFKSRSVTLSEHIKIGEVQDVSISSLDQHVLPIRQIGSSIDDIQNYVIKDKGIHFYPKSFSSDGLKEILYQRIQEMSQSGLAYISDNLFVTANIGAEIQPDEVLFDVCLIIKDFPPFVISIVQQENVNTENVIQYNLSLAREVIDVVRSFTDEPFSALYGVMADSQLETKQSVMQALKDIEMKTSSSCVPESLKLPDAKRQQIILALLSSIALTTSVDDKDDSLWFLTLEQFVILTKNIDKREVIVRTTPSSGGKVLMREIARRLERSGPTLLVMESEEQIQLARKQETCSFVLTWEEWKRAEEKDLEGLTNIVTNCQDCPPPPDITGKSWTFVAVEDTGQGQQQEMTFEAAGKLRQSVTTMIDTPPTIEGKTQRNSQVIIAELRKELETKNKENNKLKDEIEKLKETEDELSRMVDKESLGGWSVDSGRGPSDTSSVASFGSFSDANYRLVSDLPGATAGRAKKILKNVKKALKISRSKRNIENLGTIEEERKRMLMSDPGTVTDEGLHYILTEWKKANHVSLLCAQHEMDRERVNVDYCYVTEDGRLVNTKFNMHTQQGSQRFKKYRGTCSTIPIHLPPSPFSLTLVPPAPQYWETETAVGVKGREYKWWPTAMEIGVVEEDMMYSGLTFYDRPRSWCVTIGRCHIHIYYCTQVWNQGKHVTCVRDTMTNIQGSAYTLRYGVVVDIVRGRVGFVDIDKGIVLEKMDVEFRQTIYPVFGVYPDSDGFTVEMRLITGSDVTMTEDKQKLIYSCLT